MAASRLFDSGFSDWTSDQLPDLSGKLYYITGGNSGIGLEAAKMLAGAGADVVIAGRNPDKVEAAMKIVDALGGGKTQAAQLDLSSLASVRAAADQALSRFDKIDGLIDNAGIMQTPETRTVDGFELQFATNHLGHFLLAALMYEPVKKASGRIVTVSSIAHKFGTLNFDDLMGEKAYNPTTAYAQSKLANLMFALALDRRLRAANSPVWSIACHPGYSDTSLQSTGPGGFLTALYKVTNALLAQSSFHGARPTVLAAAGEGAKPGGYYGPQSMGEARGRVSDATVAARALKELDQNRLWDVSEELVGHKWAF